MYLYFEYLFLNYIGSLLILCLDVIEKLVSDDGTGGLVKLLLHKIHTFRARSSLVTAALTLILCILQSGTTESNRNSNIF